MNDDLFNKFLNESEERFNGLKTLFSDHEIEFARICAARYKMRYEEKLLLGKRILFLQGQLMNMRDALNKYANYQNWLSGMFLHEPWKIAQEALEVKHD